jgi:hypothetical protein
MEQNKPWYLSKTIMVNVLMGVAMIVAQFSPSAADFIKVYFAEAGSAWALVNIALRLITKKEIG